MTSTNEAWFDRAKVVIPGGVNSPVRSFRSVGGTPYFVARAEGPYVWDVEGTQYIDYVQSYGASILGHAHPAVIEAIRSAALRGTTYGAPTENEVLLAEELCARVSGLEQLPIRVCRARRACLWAQLRTRWLLPSTCFPCSTNRLRCSP